MTSPQRKARKSPWLPTQSADYVLPGILAGARKQEQEAAPRTK
jgi:hypothetical protein